MAKSNLEDWELKQLEKERDDLMRSQDYWRNEETQRRVREIFVRLNGAESADRLH